MMVQIARHSDPKLTLAVYGRAQLLDPAGAVDRLPSFSSSPETQIAAQATGTDGGFSDPNRLHGASTPLTPTPDDEGCRLMVVEEEGVRSQERPLASNPLSCRDLRPVAGQRWCLRPVHSRLAESPRTESNEASARPAAAPKRGRITMFRCSTVLQRPRQMRFVGSTATIPHSHKPHCIPE